MREKRHTSYGGRADQAADSPVKAKPTRSPAAERQWKHRHPVTECHTDVTGLSQNVTKPVTTPTPSMSQDVTALVTNDVTLYAEIKNLKGLVKSLTMRLDAMERWGEALEARFPARRTVAPTAPTSLAPPSVSNVAATGRVAKRYPIMIKGNRVTVTEGQAYSCYGVQGIAPWLDQDGQPIPE